MAKIGKNIGMNHGLTFNTELVIPQFPDISTMNAYTPERAGALAQVGKSTYKYDGTDWVEMNDANSSGATLRGDIPETT